MPKRIYVTNLPKSITERSLSTMFSKYGSVTSVSLSGSTAVVTMDSGGEKAIQSLNLRTVDGKSLNVNEAQPRR